jgi:hypothetical protein
MPPKSSLKRKKEDAVDVEVQGLIASLNMETLRYASEVVLDGKTRGLRDRAYLKRAQFCQSFLEKLSCNPQAATRLKKETPRWLAFQKIVRDQRRVDKISQRFNEDSSFRASLLMSGEPIRYSKKGTPAHASMWRFVRFLVTRVYRVQDDPQNVVIDGVFLDGKNNKGPEDLLRFTPPMHMFQRASDVVALYLVRHRGSEEWKAFQVLCQREYDSSTSSSSSVAVVNPLNKFVNHYLYDANVLSVVRDFLVPSTVDVS